MEPCSTWGKTPPCTDAIIAAGIKRVVVAALDPNPKHNGRGLKILRRAGIRVEQGLLADEATAMNEAFNKWITTGLPFVIAKAGMSLDGKIATRTGDAKWITGEAARREGHKLRASVDASHGRREHGDPRQSTTDGAARRVRSSSRSGWSWMGVVEHR